MTKIPENLRYTKDHEWILAEGATWRIGITQFAANQLGDIVMVDIQRGADSVLNHGETFGVIESVKSVSELYAPVSGKVTAVNADLNDEPEAVNEDPYDAWIIEIAPSNKAELDELMDAAAYTKYTAEQ